jgi:hypothetical protein
MKMTKSEIRNPKEGRMPKPESPVGFAAVLRHSGFGILSAFGIRRSDFLCHSSFGFAP